ncbi:hypothetical protein LX32DRAFT_250895 [Colletotrichum zoysiae]|uniref:Uncharacterized protein n=1 Tax=Colletotrichum zoysiae TaxID=1216348 RepID=A0AAD9H2Z4_9PEZI|nr:hypothetical protein LX32DRAFT_250895 [Colletotrichum zoysiae]
MCQTSTIRDSVGTSEQIGVLRREEISTPQASPCCCTAFHNIPPISFLLGAWSSGQYWGGRACRREKKSEKTPANDASRASARASLASSVMLVITAINALTAWFARASTAAWWPSLAVSALGGRNHDSTDGRPNDARQRSLLLCLSGPDHPVALGALASSTSASREIGIRPFVRPRPALSSLILSQASPPPCRVACDVRRPKNSLPNVPESAFHTFYVHYVVYPLSLAGAQGNSCTLIACHPIRCNHH